MLNIKLNFLMVLISSAFLDVFGSNNLFTTNKNNKNFSQIIKATHENFQYDDLDDVLVNDGIAQFKQWQRDQRRARKKKIKFLVNFSFGSLVFILFWKIKNRITEVAKIKESSIRA